MCIDILDLEEVIKINDNENNQRKCKYLEPCVIKSFMDSHTLPEEVKKWLYDNWITLHFTCQQV